MILFLILQIIMLIVCWFSEPIHDKAIIDNQIIAYNSSPENQLTVLKNDKIWHKYDGISFTLFCLMPVISILILRPDLTFQSLLLGLSLMMIRFTVFPYVLNKRRGLDPFHVGVKGMDRFFTKILGKNSGKMKTIFGITTIVGVNIALLLL